MDPSVDVMVDPLPWMDIPIPYVCMPGSPYTGSTLLGMLLAVALLRDGDDRGGEESEGVMSAVTRGLRNGTRRASREGRGAAAALPC